MGQYGGRSYFLTRSGKRKEVGRMGYINNIRVKI